MGNFYFSNMNLLTCDIIFLIDSISFFSDCNGIKKNIPFDNKIFEKQKKIILHHNSICRWCVGLHLKVNFRHAHVAKFIYLIIIHSKTVYDEKDCGLTLADVREAERDAVNVLLNLSDINVEPAKAMYDEKGVQMKSGDLITSFFSTIKSDTHLNTLTGLSNFTY
jgi:hypothetical protein